MKKLFTLLTLLVFIGGGKLWANQTTLISGVTLPDIPEGTLNLSSQTDYTPDGNGWIVETSPKENIGSKTWHSKLATDGGTASWTVPVGCTAPFVSSTGSFSRYTIRSGARTHAIRFTGAEKASFLGSRNSDTRKTVVSLFSYVGTTQTLIETKSVDSGSIGELLFNGLTASTTYIAYIYGTATDNSDWYEFALKAPVTTYTVTYKAGAGTGDDVVDDNAAVVADCPNTFTAPSGKSFCGWNTESNGSGTPYAVGATVTSNLTLFAQWSASHSVTYSLGAATGGTVPTQADVAEGATFAVAAVPGNLVPPSGKEFKCWNDGTNDYNPGATYTMSTSDVTLTAVYQDKTYQGLTPTSTMDFDNPGTMFYSVWFTNSNKMNQNFYVDAANGIAVFSAFALYQAKANSKISWMATDSGSSTAETWDATGNFKGSSYYFSSDDRAATVRATERMHYYRVKGITGASALMGDKAKMEAYLVTAGVVSADPVEEEAITAAGTLSITGLTASNEYIIKVYGDNGNSNVQFREIAFSFTAVPTVTVTPAYAKTTYIAPYALDFSGVVGLTAYVATDAKTAGVTMTPVTTVPAGTPLLLVGTASTDYNVPAIATASAPATNLLLQGDGTTTFDGTTYDYILGSDGKFHQISSGTVATTKAYLHLTSAPSGARELSIVFEDEATGVNEVRGQKEEVRGEFFDLQGRKVAQPTKGLYIVNGKKVIVK